MLRPSAVTALIRLRRRLAESPHLTALEARKLLSATYDNAGLDFDRALSLHEVIPVGLMETRAVFQATVVAVFERASPPWSALLRRGRDALRDLDPDTLTCFERAGALLHVPDPDVLRWWDELSARIYAEADLDRCRIGRDAERRSLEYERERLKGIPGAPPPSWKALDNNLAGYDIQSSMVEDELIRPKLVEVKGTVRQPIAFHITRNEWETATRHRRTYFFQIWHLATDRMVELSVDDVEAHVPVDRGRGQWREILVEIPPS